MMPKKPTWAGHFLSVILNIFMGADSWPSQVMCFFQKILFNSEYFVNLPSFYFVHLYASEKLFCDFILFEDISTEDQINLLMPHIKLCYVLFLSLSPSPPPFFLLQIVVRLHLLYLLQCQVQFFWLFWILCMILLHTWTLPVPSSEGMSMTSRRKEAQYPFNFPCMFLMKDTYFSSLFCYDSVFGNRAYMPALYILGCLLT